MADPAAGGAIGVLFTEFYSGAYKLIKNYIEFEPLLGDLEKTLAALNPLIQNISVQNRSLHLPNQVTENLKEDIEEGLKLVRKYSAAGAVVGCLKKPTTYTTQIRKLDESLRRQLDILKGYEVWVVNESYSLLTLVAEKMEIIPKDRQPNYRNDLVCYRIEIEDSPFPVLMNNQNDAVLGEVKSTTASTMSSGPVDVFRGAGGGGLRFEVLYDCLKELTSKSTIYKSRRLKGIISKLDSLVPLIQQIAESNNDELEGIENFRLSMEEGVKVASKYSKVSKWRIFAQYKYANKLLQWEESFLRLILKFKGIIQEELFDLLSKSRALNSQMRDIDLKMCRIMELLRNSTESTTTELNVYSVSLSVTNVETTTNRIEMNSVGNTHVAVAQENLNLNAQGTRKVKENLDSFTEEVGTSEVKELSDSSVSGIEAHFGIQNQSETEAGCALPELPQPIVGLDLPLEELQRETVKDDYCSDDAEFAVLPNDEVLVPLQIASPLKIPTLRTVFPLRLRQPENKKKRLAHKSHISSSDVPTLPPEHNSSTDHSRHMSSANSTISIEFCQEDSSSTVDGQVRTHILPVDLERYEKEKSSQLSRVGMQDMYLAMQRFHVMSTRLVQSEERVALLETNYQKAEESWKLEHWKLSEQHNSAMAQVASLTKEKDSLAERIKLLEENKVTSRQEAQEILTNECVPEFKRQIQVAEKDCFELGCRVGFKSFLAKVENKFPNLDLSDISHFESIGFDLKVIEELLGSDHDNEADNSDEEDGNDEERGGKGVAAEVPEDLLELLYHYAVDNMIDGTTIIVNMEEEVLGVAKPIYILREDVMQFMKMTPISATCINVYMRHLYDVLKQSNIDGMVRFCDASSISVGKPDEKSQVLATRLQQLSTNQILLVPYNSGNHWILTIVNEEKDICFFMDPIHSLRDPLEWKSIVNNGIKRWNHQTGRGLHKSPVWKILKGPKQPSTVECGYYVMRYMKEMVENISLSFAKKWDSKKYFSAYKETERPYTNREIDEVQWEWASLFFFEQWEWASLVYEQKRRGLRMAGSG